MAELIDKQKARRWRRDTFRLLQSIDRRWRPTDQTFSGATVLVAIAAIGTETHALVALTGYSLPFVTKILRRARKHGIVVGEKMRTGWDSDTGGFALICDALVVGSVIARVPDPKRSAIQKAAAKKRDMTQPRRKRVKLTAGAMFSPKQVKSDPLYLHEKWLQGK